MSKHIHIPPAESPPIRNNWMAVRELLGSFLKVNETQNAIVKGIVAADINAVVKKMKALLPDIESQEKEIKKLKSLILKLINDFNNFETEAGDELSLIDAFSLAPEISTGTDSEAPPASLHVRSGDTPSIQLEQDDSESNPTRTWYIRSDDTKFKVEDNTAGTTPVKVSAGAPDNSFCIDSNGNIGIGTSTPAEPFELQTTGENADIIVNRSDGATGIFGAGAGIFYFGSQSNHALRLYVYNNWKMRLNTDGTLDMSDGGGYDGEWFPASSMVYKENIETLTDIEAAEAFALLNPVRFNYKVRKGKVRVGFIAEDVPEVFQVEGIGEGEAPVKSISIMGILALLTKVVQEQQKKIDNLVK